jgi:hypothetical protein
MEKNRSRALNRHHKQRKRRHAERVADKFFRYSNDAKWKENWIRRNMENLKAYSCDMCSNWRKYGVLSFQEQKYICSNIDELFE